MNNAYEYCKKSIELETTPKKVIWKHMKVTVYIQMYQIKGELYKNK